MTLPEIVLDLRAQIEKLLPGWKIWARLDIATFQFFGWKNSIRNCVHSDHYSIRYIPKASEIAEYMHTNLERMNELAKL